MIIEGVCSPGRSIKINFGTKILIVTTNMDFFSLLSQHIHHNNITLNITFMFSFSQHPQPLCEPGSEDEVHVAGVDRLEQG